MWRPSVATLVGYTKTLGMEHHSNANQCAALETQGLGGTVLSVTIFSRAILARAS